MMAPEKAGIVIAVVTTRSLSRVAPRAHTNIRPVNGTAIPASWQTSFYHRHGHAMPAIRLVIDYTTTALITSECRYGISHASNWRLMSPHTVNIIRTPGDVNTAALPRDVITASHVNMVVTYHGEREPLLRDIIGGDATRC